MRTQVEHLQGRSRLSQTYVETQRTEMLGKIKAADDVLANRSSGTERGPAVITLVHHHRGLDRMQVPG